RPAARDGHRAAPEHGRPRRGARRLAGARRGRGTAGRGAGGRPGHVPAAGGAADGAERAVPRDRRALRPRRLRAAHLRVPRPRRCRLTRRGGRRPRPGPRVAPHPPRPVRQLPYWQGSDSGYASYRAQVMGRWPTAGPPDAFGTAAAYRQRIRDLLATGVIMDEGMVYLDARP